MTDTRTHSGAAPTGGSASQPRAAAGGTLAPPPATADVAVVGGGIVGLSVASQLARAHPDRTVVVLEREDALAQHQTSHNSGVVHAGIYYRPGSLKARLCVDGARALRRYCAERGIPVRELGKVIVATDERELPRLRDLAARAEQNGVPRARLIDADELRELEPHVRGIAALHSPWTAVVSYPAVARALADDLAACGGSVHTGCEVTALRHERDGVVLVHRHGTVRAGGVVLCAGGFADRLAVGERGPRDPRLVPFRGAYMALRPERAALVNGLIYPVPDPDLPFLGMHFTRTVDDEVIVGPTALMVGAVDAYRLRRVSLRDAGTALAWPGTWRLMRRWWRTGLHELRIAASARAFLAEARRYVPALEPDDLVPARAGVRAQPVDRDGGLVDDFVIVADRRVLNVRSAPSPAATSAVVLGRHIAERAEAAFGLPRTITTEETTP